MPRGPRRARFSSQSACEPRRTRRALGLALGLALISASLSESAAAAPRVEVQMNARPEATTVGGRVQLEIRVDSVGGRIDRVELPDLSGFTVLGHRQSSPVRFQFGLRAGATVEATEIHQFTLRADAPGTFEIAAPVAVVEGERYEGAPVRVEVEGDPSVDAPPGASSSDPGEGEQQASLPIDEIFDARAFLRTSVDRGEVYVGEQVTYEVELYTRVGGSPRFTKEASTDGFWVHDLLDPNRRPPERREVVRGVPFHVYTIKRIAAFPLRAGELRIGAPRLEIASSSPFGRGGTLVRTGAPISVDVRPLPRGTPADALVGQFTLRARLDRQSLKVGEAATLTAAVEGRGHVRDVEFTVNSLDGVRVLAPEVDTSTTIRKGQVHGKREARFLLIAERPGVYRIPRFSLDVFDPDTERTEKLTTTDFRILVEDEEGESPSYSEPEERGEASPREARDDLDERSLGSFRGRSELRRQDTELAERPLFLALLALPPALLALALGAFALARRVRAERGRRERERRHQRLLVEARERRAAGDAPGLYAALASSIHAALEELLGANTRGLTHREIERELRAKGAPRELVARAIEELEGLDFARFAAESTHPEEMDRAMSRIAAIIDRVDALGKESGA